MLLDFEPCAKPIELHKAIDIVRLDISMHLVRMVSSGYLGQAILSSCPLQATVWVLIAIGGRFVKDKDDRSVRVYSLGFLDLVRLYACNLMWPNRSVCMLK